MDSPRLQRAPCLQAVREHCASRSRWESFCGQLASGKQPKRKACMHRCVLMDQQHNVAVPEAAGASLSVASPNASTQHDGAVQRGWELQPALPLFLLRRHNNENQFQTLLKTLIGDRLPCQEQGLGAAGSPPTSRLQGGKQRQPGARLHAFLASKSF